VIRKAIEAPAAHRAGVGGPLNATSGNATELIIARVILFRGPEPYPVVKATLPASVISNLLVLGALIMTGGDPRQPIGNVSVLFGLGNPDAHIAAGYTMSSFCRRAGLPDRRHPSCKGRYSAPSLTAPRSTV
jgi:hypothetical protein